MVCLLCCMYIPMCLLTTYTLSKSINFTKLEELGVQPIGLFGSRQEVLDMLLKFGAISNAMAVALGKDVDHELLQPGIHAVLPINLHKPSAAREWDHVVYLFYWSMPNSFDMEKMKAVKYMRKVSRVSTHF